MLDYPSNWHDLLASQAFRVARVGTVKVARPLFAELS